MYEQWNSANDVDSFNLRLVRLADGDDAHCLVTNGEAGAIIVESRPTEAVEIVVDQGPIDSVENSLSNNTEPNEQGQ